MIPPRASGDTEEDSERRDGGEKLPRFPDHECGKVIIRGAAEGLPDVTGELVEDEDVHRDGQPSPSGERACGVAPPTYECEGHGQPRTLRREQQQQ